MPSSVNRGDNMTDKQAVCQPFLFSIFLIDLLINVQKELAFFFHDWFSNLQRNLKEKYKMDNNSAKNKKNGYHIIDDR